jgi:hypothetical protein
MTGVGAVGCLVGAETLSIFPGAEYGAVTFSNADMVTAGILRQIRERADQ